MSAPSARSGGSSVACRLAILAALALLSGSPVAAADDPAAPGVPPAPPKPPVDPKKARADFDAAQKAFVASVNQAIDAGQKHLLDTQGPDGDWSDRKAGAAIPPDAYGELALVLTALAKTGVKPTHPKMQLGVKLMGQLLVERRGFQRFQGTLPGHRTYAAACVAMLYDALYVEHPHRGPDGKMSPAKMKDALPKGERDEIRDIVTFFTGTQRKHLWRYPGPPADDEDLSATQYALLGLITAGRVGAHAPPAVYRRALERLLAWQEVKAGDAAELVPLWFENPAWDPSDRYPRYAAGPRFPARGWSYQGKGKVTGSMTCAGISCLAIIKDRLKQPGLKPPASLSKEEEKAVDRAINCGIAWLSKNFTVTENPGDGAGWHYYYLYGMERAASLIGLANIGPHDWYREAATYLVQQQRADGSWPPSGDKATDSARQTAFALLVLERATVPTGYGPPPTTGGVEDEPKVNGDATPPEAPKPGDGPPPR